VLLHFLLISLTLNGVGQGCGIDMIVISTILETIGVGNWVLVKENVLDNVPGATAKTVSITVAAVPTARVPIVIVFVT
jgi:hypothetical protein